MANERNNNNKQQQIPDIPENQKVEYSKELADSEDREAINRMEEANQRVKNSEQ
ncbi:YfhD family protein [Evansella sp. AB-P1]|uniref:YfhD family protein n=1 Tax=Evansella sp. AB-P1 TaxID=3037653 RepID=UPI00241F84E7|nr:YfhD family protein [Evansella sp. AB-P1]MDG5786230.1 YfhD family protein [Evansella sp. AB-P1]